MENITEKSTESNINGSILNLNTAFNSVFGDLVAVDENTKNDLQNDSDNKNRHEGLTQPKRSQTDSTIVQRNLEIHLSADAQKKIQDILNEVRKLSEKEKLLLYLKLPTKAGNISEESPPIPLSNTRQEQTQAFQWIRSNLEECENTHTLPKHEVYDDYKAHCESLGPNRTLSAPDFGKIIKCVFPRVKARRLGTRGNSKYCYSGLRKKIITEAPSLPNLKDEGEVNNNNNTNNSSNGQTNEITEDQTLSAACSLVCEWANKLLGRVFSTLLDLARFLVGGSYVSTKSMSAFVVMSATESKVRKMSEKLQLWSASSSSSVQSSDSRSSPLTHSVTSSSESNINSAKSKMTTAGNRRQQQPQQQQQQQQQQTHMIASNNKVKIEASNSLIISDGTSNLKGNTSQFMSPPPSCPAPPPKTPSHMTSKCATSAAVSSPVLAAAVHVPMQSPRGSLSASSGHSLLRQLHQTGDVMQHFENVQVLSPSQGLNSASAMEPQQQPMSRSHVSRTASSMLRRADSCPYPSQSPRTPRQQLAQASAMSPNRSMDIARSRNWPTPSIQDGPTASLSIQSMRDAGNQITSPLQRRSPSVQHDVMTTPPNRQQLPPLQRCHSVPVPFSGPPGDVCHPLTPQLGGLGAGAAAGHHSASYLQMKDMRNKFMANDVTMSSNARRNLTPFLMGNEQSVVMNAERTGVEAGNSSGAIVTDTGSGMNSQRKSVEVGAMEMMRGNPLDIRNGDVRPSVVADNSIAGSGTIGTMGSPCSTMGKSVPAESTTQGIVNTMVPLETVDNLIDGSFPLGDIPTSGGNELGDFDGLDDATTMDLLRSLNSGNNIWANEWNTGNGSGMMMESN